MKKKLIIFYVGIGPWWRLFSRCRGYTDYSWDGTKSGYDVAIKDAHDEMKRHHIDGIITGITVLEFTAR